MDVRADPAGWLLLIRECFHVGVLAVGHDTDENIGIYHFSAIQIGRFGMIACSVDFHLSERLLDFVDILQQELVRAEVLPLDYDFEAHKVLVSMQLGDVPVTYADISELEKDFGFKPKVNLREGLKKFVIWYKKFYLK